MLTHMYNTYIHVYACIYTYMYNRCIVHLIAFISHYWTLSTKLSRASEQWQERMTASHEMHAGWSIWWQDSQMFHHEM